MSVFQVCGAPVPDQQLGNPGQLVGALGQYLIETRHCWIDHKADRGNDAVVLLGTLSVVDTKNLMFVVAGTMLLGEKLNRRFDEGVILPHLPVADVYMDRLFYHLLLETFL